MVIVDRVYKEMIYEKMRLDCSQEALLDFPFAILFGFNLKMPVYKYLWTRTLTTKYTNQNLSKLTNTSDGLLIYHSHIKYTAKCVHVRVLT